MDNNITLYSIVGLVCVCMFVPYVNSNKSLTTMYLWYTLVITLFSFSPFPSILTLSATFSCELKLYCCCLCFNFLLFSTNFPFLLLTSRSFCVLQQKSKKSLLSVYLCEFSQVFFPLLLSFLMWDAYFCLILFLYCSIKREKFIWCERRTIYQARLGIQYISIISSSSVY
jgi:hypothetical protein